MVSTMHLTNVKKPPGSGINGPGRCTYQIEFAEFKSTSSHGYLNGGRQQWTPTVPQWRAWSTSRSFSNSAGGERFRKPSSAVSSSSSRPAAGSEKSARTANNTTHSFTHKFHCPPRSCVLSFFCRARPRLPVNAACYSAVPVPTTSKNGDQKLRFTTVVDRRAQRQKRAERHNVP